MHSGGAKVWGREGPVVHSLASACGGSSSPSQTRPQQVRVPHLLTVLRSSGIEQGFSGGVIVSSGHTGQCLKHLCCHFWEGGSAGVCGYSQECCPGVLPCTQQLVSPQQRMTLPEVLPAEAMGWPQELLRLPAWARLGECGEGMLTCGVPCIPRSSPLSPAHGGSPGDSPAMAVSLPGVLPTPGLSIFILCSLAWSPTPQVYTC